jgi:glycine cleavage system transcriptional repressor
MGEYAVAAMGEDRPGIVAEVTEALLAAGASIEDSSMTILGGQFAMLLLVDCDHAEADLTAALLPAAQQLGLMLEVRPTSSQVSNVERDEYVIAAYGPDRPGLVAALARVLGNAGANIADFGSRVTEGGVFAMWFNVALPSGADIDALAGELRAAGGEVSLDVSVHSAEVEAL